MNAPLSFEEKIIAVVRHKHTLWLVFLFGTLVGLVLAFPGVNTWDDVAQEGHTQWLLNRYGLAPTIEILPYDQLYGPLWSLILGLLDIPLRSLQDPSLFRHAFTFALYPAGLVLLLRLLLRAGVSFSTGVLALALISGLIRLGGHALLNVKDFPHAMAFLLVSLALWIVLKEKLQDQGRAFSTKELFWLTLLSLVPYLCRTPLLFHFAGLWVFLLLYALAIRHSFSRAECIRMVALPWLYFFLTVLALFPVIWQAGPKPWVHMFVFFGKVYTEGSVRIFDIDYPSQALPRWYSLVWIPLMAQPLALVVAALGIAAAICTRLKAKDFRIQTHLLPFSLSLKLWLGIILLGAWSSVTIKAPRLYDEERHILFLYPLLFLLAALGLDWLKPRYKYILSALLLLVTLQQHLAWGKYAYIYKNPLLGNLSSTSFMGDYWGVCMNDLIPQLPQNLPDLNKEILVPMARGVALQQYARLRDSHLFGKKFPELKLVDSTDEKDFYLILIQRQPYFEQELQREGRRLQAIFHTATLPQRDPQPEALPGCIVYQAQK